MWTANNLTLPAKVVLAKAIAHNFSIFLRRSMTAEHFTKLVELTTAETNSHICHSHDFVDANVVMEEAFITTVRDIFGNKDEVDLCQDNANREMWNAAWTMAKDFLFNTNSIKRIEGSIYFGV